MKKKFTKAGGLILGLILILTAAVGMMSACSGGGNNKKDEGKVVIEVSIPGLGLGGTWMPDFASRFEEAYANKVYSDDKTGVSVHVNEEPQGNDMNSLSTDGNAILIAGVNKGLAYHVSRGELLNINDVVTKKYDQRDSVTMSIEDKMFDNDRDIYKIDGEYYALPDYEYGTAITYDRNLFNKLGLYFAKPEATQSVPFHSAICNADYKFIIPGNTADKSCGPDGKYGNDDDGLPSSLFELAALCEYMKKVHTISPFALTGAYKYYCSVLLDAIMVGLQGKNASTDFTLSGEEYEVITGWTNEKLFPGSKNNILKPIVQKIPITEETGYYTSWSSAKYYAEAFVELITEQEWWFSGTKLDTKSHYDTQADFIYSGYGSNERIGMLVEFSYWYNEASFSHSFDYFYQEYPEVTQRDIAYMPLPVSLDKTSTEGNGEDSKMLVTSGGTLVVNANIAGDSILVEAVKDFITYYYTDVELSRVSADFGLPKRLNYKILDEHEQYLKSSYAKTMIDMATSDKVVRIVGNTATFNANKTSLFKRGFEDSIFNLPGTSCCFTEIYVGRKNAKQCFETQMIDKTSWANLYYKGSSTVGDYNGLTYNA